MLDDPANDSQMRFNRLGDCVQRVQRFVSNVDKWSYFNTVHLTDYPFKRRFDNSHQSIESLIEVLQIRFATRNKIQDPKVVGLLKQYLMLQVILLKLNFFTQARILLIQY